MNTKEATRQLDEAEKRSARTWRRLMYLRDSELLDYDVEDLYRIALRDHQLAHTALLKARAFAAVTLPELLPLGTAEVQPAAGAGTRQSVAA